MSLCFKYACVLIFGKCMELGIRVVEKGGGRIGGLLTWHLTRRVRCFDITWPNRGGVRKGQLFWVQRKE